MDLERLAACIVTLQGRIAQHRESLGKYERRTRVALIDPLLQALGWDTTDPATVEAEHIVDTGGPVGKKLILDYALFDDTGKLVAVIEAKKLGTELAEHLLQITSYATAGGIPYAVLTDGDRWEMYDIFQSDGKLDDKRILNISIAEGVPRKLAVEFILLWRANMVTGTPIAASMPFAIPDAESTSVPGKVSSLAASATQQASDTVEQVGKWLSLSSFNVDDHELPPSQIKYRDGTICSITSWRDLLTGTASWVWGKGYLKEKDLPVVYSGKTYICHTDPTHPTGKKFSAPKLIAHAPPLYCEAAFPNREVGVKRIKALLEKCGQSIDAVFVLPHSS